MHDTVLDTHILNIIQNNNISEQGELHDILLERGFDIPQATLSRRLQKLKIAKVSGVYKIVDLNYGFLPVVLKISISEFGLVVLHTHPGQANSLAYFLDKKYIRPTDPYLKDNSGIIGTLAGDDVVLVVVKSKNDLEKVLKVLHDDFPYLKESKE